MWKNLFFCMLVAVTIVLLLGVVASSSDGRDRDVIGYNVLAERVFEGSVEGTPYLAGQMMYFPLRTADSLVYVHVGPKEFVERSHFKVKAGDMMTVTGMPVIMNGRYIVLAREVRNGNAVLVLRDPMGLPLWESDGPIQMDPERHMGLWEVCSVIK